MIEQYEHVKQAHHRDALRTMRDILRNNSLDRSQDGVAAPHALDLYFQRLAIAALVSPKATWRRVYGLARIRRKQQIAAMISFYTHPLLSPNDKTWK